MATRSDRVSVRLEADELLMLRQLATNLDVSTSDALRAMIRDTFTRKKLTLKGKAPVKKTSTKKAPTKKKAPAKKKGTRK